MSPTAARRGDGSRSGTVYVVFILDIVKVVIHLMFVQVEEKHYSLVSVSAHRSLRKTTGTSVLGGLRVVLVLDNPARRDSFMRVLEAGGATVLALASMGGYREIMPGGVTHVFLDPGVQAGPKRGIFQKLSEHLEETNPGAPLLSYKFLCQALMDGKLPEEADFHIQKPASGRTIGLGDREAGGGLKRVGARDQLKQRVKQARTDGVVVIDSSDEDSEVEEVGINISDGEDGEEDVMIHLYNIDSSEEEDAEEDDKEDYEDDDKEDDEEDGGEDADGVDIDEVKILDETKHVQPGKSENTQTTNIEQVDVDDDSDDDIEILHEKLVKSRAALGFSRVYIDHEGSVREVKVEMLETLSEDYKTDPDLLEDKESDVLGSPGTPPPWAGFNVGGQCS